MARILSFFDAANEEIRITDWEVTFICVKVKVVCFEFFVKRAKNCIQRISFF
jgi:hypothetical protein